MMRFIMDRGWQRFANKLDTRMRLRVQRASDIGTRRAAIVMQARVRQEIRDGDFEPNAPLTVTIKNSTKPLVDKGQLFQAITHQKMARAVYFVGVTKARSEDAANLARIVHDGVTIPVTNRMRSFFFYLWLATSGRMAIEDLSERGRAIAERAVDVIYPIQDNTTHIRIPGRPFLKNAFSDQATLAHVRSIWVEAVAAALRG